MSRQRQRNKVKTNYAIMKITKANQLAGRFRTVGITSPLLLLLFLLLPIAGQAQYTYLTNNTITITRYLGSGTAVTIPSTINGLPVTSIGAYAFYYSTSLTNVTIPASVTSIGYGAFEFCSSLASVVIPTNVTSIGTKAFGNCGGLTNVTLSPHVTSIEPETFEFCSSLTDVVIPANVTNIGFEAFDGCTSLTSITIPAGVTSVGEEAFYACANLTLVNFLGNAPSSLSNPLIFTGANNATIYYLPGATGFGPTFGGRPTAVWTGQPLANVTVIANPPQGGAVLGGGTYVVGFSPQISANVTSEWAFTGWNDGSTNNPYTITVPATNITYTANFQMTTPVITTMSTLPATGRGNAYSLAFAAAGGIAPYAWKATSKLPTGLQLSNFGTLSGTPTVAGTTAFSIQVTDNGGLSNATQFSLTVVDAATPFAALVGTYTGLILQTNNPTHASSGFVQLVLTRTGAFTGNLTLAGVKTAFKGQFDLTGNVNTTVAGVRVALHVDVIHANGPITGTVSSSDFTSELSAELPGTIQVEPGTYKLILSPADASATNVPGFGYATLTISKSGSGSLSGVLNDGTKLSAKAPVAQSDLWPLYVSLDKGAGSCIGLISFITNTTLTAVVDWFPPAAPGGSAVLTKLDLIGSMFVANQSTITGTNRVIISGGGLGGDLVKTVTITGGQVAVLNPGRDALKVTLTLKTGQFTGTFIPPTGTTPIPFSGLLLQVQADGAGLFQNSGKTGGITIEPAP